MAAKRQKGREVSKPLERGRIEALGQIVYSPPRNLDNPQGGRAFHPHTDHVRCPYCKLPEGHMHNVHFGQPVLVDPFTSGQPWEGDGPAIVIPMWCDDDHHWNLCIGSNMFQTYLFVERRRDQHPADKLWEPPTRQERWEQLVIDAHSFLAVDGLIESQKQAIREVIAHLGDDHPLAPDARPDLIERLERATTPEEVADALADTSDDLSQELIRALTESLWAQEE